MGAADDAGALLKRCHPDYEGKEGDEGYAELDLMNRYTETPGYPCLLRGASRSTRRERSSGSSSATPTTEVDTEGTSSYIDNLRVELVADAEVRTLQVAQVVTTPRSAV